MGASESRSHHPCADPFDRANAGGSSEQPVGTERDWLVWPYTSRKASGRSQNPPEPMVDRLCVDNAFAIGVFDSPTPAATRVGELYKGQVVAGVAEWHTRVGRGPLGLGLGCSEEDTWLRLAAQSLPWAEGTPSELWVHMEHRHASCCDGVQLQVYLVEAPRKAPPPLPEPEPEPEPKPELHQRTPPRYAVESQVEADHAEPLAGAIDRSSIDVLRSSASSLEAMEPLAAEIDRSSLDVQRVSASSLEAMRLSNSSRCSFEGDVAEVEAEAEAVGIAISQKQSHEPGTRGNAHESSSSTVAAELQHEQNRDRAARSCERQHDGDDLRAMRKQLKATEAAESDARP